MGIAAEPLEGLVVSIFRHAGSDADEAEAIAEHLVDANLVGHDSHGVIRILPYLKLLQQGGCWPTAGQRLAGRRRSDRGRRPARLRPGRRRAGDRARHRARASTASPWSPCATPSHLGRIGDWAEQAAAGRPDLAALRQHHGRRHPGRPLRRHQPAALGQPDRGGRARPGRRRRSSSTCRPAPSPRARSGSP